MTLTPELRHEIEMAGEGPVTLTDPQTNETYYLVRAEQYERLKAILDLGSSVEEMAPYLAETFREGWDDPALDVYNDLDPRKAS